MEKQSKTQEAKLCPCRTAWEWQAEQIMPVLHSFLHSGCWGSNRWLHGSWAAAGCGVKAARNCRSTWKFPVLETDLLGAAPPEKPLGAFKPDETPQTHEILSPLIWAIHCTVQVNKPSPLGLMSLMQSLLDISAFFTENRQLPAPQATTVWGDLHFRPLTCRRWFQSHFRRKRS